MTQALVFFVLATLALSLCNFLQFPATIYFIMGAAVTFILSIVDDLIRLKGVR